MIRLIELLKEIGDSSYPYKKDPDSSKDEIIYKLKQSISKINQE